LHPISIGGGQGKWKWVGQQSSRPDHWSEAQKKMSYPV